MGECGSSAKKFGKISSGKRFGKLGSSKRSRKQFSVRILVTIQETSLVYGIRED